MVTGGAFPPRLGREDAVRLRDGGRGARRILQGSSPDLAVHEAQWVVRQSVGIP